MEVDALPATELRFRAMGSDCHLMVVGDPGGVLKTTRNRILALEQLWSRFIPTSEVSLLNTSQGFPVLVSDDTLELVEKAIEAKRLTEGRFDATILGDLIRAGYDRSFEDIAAGAAGVSHLFRGPITVVGPTVVLATDTGFDPGGIGKGLAADIAAREAIADGAAGVSINLGGDVRVAGQAPYPDGWSIAIEHPGLPEPLVTVGLVSGAVATSTRLLRRWTQGDASRHHLIDPATGLSADTDLTLVSVLASEAWRAEVYAKACLLAGSTDWLEPIAGTGLEAVAVTATGSILSTRGLADFTEFIPIQLTQLEKEQ